MSKSRIQPGVLLRGMAMGMAEVVPGVSGGTIAFITGIYERLLLAIKSVDGSFFRLLLGFKWVSAFRHIDGLFLTTLLTGMACGIVGAIFTVSYLLEHYPPAIWAFFFGLIVGSTIYVLKQIKKWTPLLGLIVILGTVVAYLIVRSVPAEGNTNLLYVYVCGTIAISALMLPGISGSFILLLMGMYKYVTGTLKDLLVDFTMDKLVVMIVFGLGCLTGLAAFSRVLTWTFKHYKAATLAALSGFMIGSLWKIWPWRLPVLWMDEAGIVHDAVDKPFPVQADHVKLLVERNVLPSDYAQGPDLLLWSILTALIGFGIVFFLDRFSPEEVRVDDVESSDSV